MILLVKIWMNKFLYNRIKFKILWEIGLYHVNAFIIICLRDDFLITFIPSICVRILTKEIVEGDKVDRVKHFCFITWMRCLKRKL